LVFKTKKVPKILAVLLVLAALGYLLIHIMPLLPSFFGNYKSLIDLIFMAPMILGELGLAIWLLI